MWDTCMGCAFYFHGSQIKTDIVDFKYKFYKDILTSITKSTNVRFLSIEKLWALKLIFELYIFSSLSLIGQNIHVNFIYIWKVALILRKLESSSPMGCFIPILMKRK